MKRVAPFLVIAAGILWGTMGIFVRSLNDMGLNAMQIVEVRCIIAALLLIPFIYIKDKSLLKITKKNIAPLAGSAVFSIIFFNFCYFSAIEIMDMAVAAILLYTAPIFVSVMSVLFFKEKLTKHSIIALILAFVGCVLVSGIVGNSVKLPVNGLLLGLGAGFGYALYSIFSRVSLNQGLNSMTITVYTFLFAAIAGIIFTDFEKIGTAFNQYGIKLGGLAILYTVITTILPYLLYTTGLRYVKTGTASVFASIEPVVAAVLGFVVFQEKPTLVGLTGIILVLGALIYLNASEGIEKEQ